MAELELPAHLTLWLLLAALPLLLASCTAFTKVWIVLAALRHGLGAQALLPAGTMLSLSLIVTALAMAPVGEQVWLGIEDAGGLAALELAPFAAWLELLAPLHEFLHEHASPDERRYFAALAGLSEDHPLALVPAFMVSELVRGCELAAMVVVPFLVVDFIAAQVMVLLGLGQTPSAVLALPAKLLLFVSASGWHTIIGGLIEGYR